MKVYDKSTCSEPDRGAYVDFFLFLWRGKWFIGLFCLLSCMVSLIYLLFFAQVLYRSKAVLLPKMGSSGGITSIMNQFSLPFDISSSGKVDVIMSYLDSMSIKELLIKKHDLLPVLYSDLWDKDAKQWKVKDKNDIPNVEKAIQRDVLGKREIYQVRKDKKTNLITLYWVGSDPELCSLMLSSTIDELKNYLDNEYVTDAKREREFIEQRYNMVTQEMEFWENQVPSGTQSSQKINREYQASRLVFAELRKQFEMAKINEAKENISFKVLDSPYVPAVKFKPERSNILALTLVSSLIAATLLFACYEKASSLLRDRKRVPGGVDVSTPNLDGEFPVIDSM